MGHSSLFPTAVWAGANCTSAGICDQLQFA